MREMTVLPLVAAAMNGDVAAVRRILEAGTTVLDASLGLNGGITPLCVAVRKGHEEVVGGGGKPGDTGATWQADTTSICRGGRISSDRGITFEGRGRGGQGRGAKRLVTAALCGARGPLHSGGGAVESGGDDRKGIR